MKTQRFKMFALATLFVFVYSCATRMYHLAPEEVRIRAPKDTLTVTLKDGSEVKLKNASLSKDKLAGYTAGNTRQEIDLSSIRAVVVKKEDYYFAVLGVGVLAIAAWLSIGAATAPSPPPSESCPFIYSFDGARYLLDAEPYGGAICQGLERTEWCGLEHLKETDGLYRLLITNELDESQYTDELKLVVVDHPEGIKVAPDATGKIHTFSDPLAPLSAVQNRQEDILELVAAKDLKIWASGYEDKSFPKKEGLRDELVFEFPKPENARTAKLLVNAATDFWGSRVAKEFLSLFGSGVSEWYAAVNARGPEFHKIMSWYLREELYLLQVRVETPGGWKVRGIINGGGPFVSEDKAYLLDISDVPGETLRIKLLPPTQFWNIDSLAIDYSEDVGVNVTEVAPEAAGGRADPGVADLLAANDDRYFVMPRTGDSAELSFSAPPGKPGLSRSLFLKAVGYYDIHLEAQREPQTGLIKALLTLPGATLEYAFETYEAGKRSEAVRSQK